jgi:predicted O-methyltransferase YrrM
LKKLNSERFDLIFIDGHHDGKALLSYIEDLKNHIHDDTIIVLDDIRWSASMLKSWNLLRNSNEFNLSLDFFRMGILIKRPQQAKEHFVLKA